jgi:hypothetical protein
MIKRLKHWWKNFQYWRWPPKKKIKNPHYHCCCTSCIEDDEPTQGLHEVEIDPNTLEGFTIDPAYTNEETENPIKTESDGDNQINIMISILIPLSSDRLNGEKK